MKKFKLLALLPFCAMMSAPAFAGKVITYTATSQQSQEAANNAAMAGVAKQISTQVKVNQSLSREYVSFDGKSKLTENYNSDNKVFSDLKIKGIKVKTETADKGFKATATLDLDEFTSEIRFAMKSLRIKIAKLEEAGSQALKERQYANAIEAIERAKNIVPEYNVLLNELAQVYPINDSLRLNENVTAVESQAIKALSKLKFKFPTSLELTKPEAEFSITVYDGGVAVRNFPLTAKQGRHILTDVTTDDNGFANLKLLDIDIEKGPFVIVVEPNFPEGILKAAGLRKKMEIDFRAKQSRCDVNIRCDASEALCNTLEKKLAQKSIFISSAAESPKLDFKISTTAGKKIEYQPGKFTTAYDVNLFIKGEGVVFTANVRETGKQESEAAEAAIKKTNFAPLKKQMEPHCK